jgi:hypothetical protein
MRWTSPSSGAPPPMGWPCPPPPPPNRSIPAGGAPIIDRPPGGPSAELLGIDPGMASGRFEPGGMAGMGGIGSGPRSAPGSWSMSMAVGLAPTGATPAVLSGWADEPETPA